VALYVVCVQIELGEQQLGDGSLHLLVASPVEGLWIGQ
jgi:hypothetical protein